MITQKTLQDVILYNQVAFYLRNVNLWKQLVVSNPHFHEVAYFYNSESIITLDNITLLNIECIQTYPDLKWIELFESIYHVAKRSNYYDLMNANNDVSMLLYKPEYDLNGNVIKSELIHMDILFNSEFELENYYYFTEELLMNYNQDLYQYVFEALDKLNILLIKKHK